MKKSILLLLPVLVLSGCNSSDKAKTVVEYLKAPKALAADHGYCQANPVEENTAKCKNSEKAFVKANLTYSPFYKCLTRSNRKDSFDFTADNACIDRVAKEKHMLP